MWGSYVPKADPINVDGISLDLVSSATTVVKVSKYISLVLCRKRRVNGFDNTTTIKGS